MANISNFAAALIAVTVASSQPMNAEMIEAIACQCGIDEDTVINMADEVLSAKAIADEDMFQSMKGGAL